MFMLMDHCLSRVRAYEVLQEPRPVMSQETLTRATPAYLINTSPRLLALSDVVNLGIHLCSAVQYLHRHNVLHLDLKSSNVVSERQLAKVIDLRHRQVPGAGQEGSENAPVHGPRAGPWRLP
jgi:serine/threonine protein kinase